MDHEQFSGVHGTVGRIGAMITPYIAQVLLRKSPVGAISVYGTISKHIYQIKDDFSSLSFSVF